MVKRKTKRMWGWILVSLGLAGVYIPHIGFLANLIPTLDVISHPVLEIISASVILVGIFVAGGLK